jgi:hypothetical protein
VLRLVYIDAAYDRAAQLRRFAAAPAPDVAPPMTAADRASATAYLAYQRRARLDLARFWGAPVERDFLASLAVDSAGGVRWRQPASRFGEIIQGASLAPPEYADVRAPALALYATLPQLIAPAGATAEEKAAMERFEREVVEPWAMESIAQFQAGVRLRRVERLAGVHHLFLDRPEETLRLVLEFLRTPLPAPRPGDAHGSASLRLQRRPAASASSAATGG